MLLKAYLWSPHTLVVAPEEFEALSVVVVSSDTVDVAETVSVVVLRDCRGSSRRV